MYLTREKLFRDDIFKWAQALRGLRYPNREQLQNSQYILTSVEFKFESLCTVGLEGICRESLLIDDFVVLNTSSFFHQSKNGQF